MAESVSRNSLRTTGTAFWAETACANYPNGQAYNIADRESKAHDMILLLLVRQVCALGHISKRIGRLNLAD
jgi:hypothetical protein